MTEQRLISTADAALQIGCTPGYLRVILARNPQLQPKQRFADAWLWTPEEVEAVRNRNKKPGRPAKKSD